MTDYTAYEVPATSVNQLPVMNPGRPVGRDDLLKEIINHLTTRRAVQLVGAAGIGKTALAAALSAFFVKESGVVWLSNGTHPFPELLVRMGRALGLEDVTQSEQPAGRVGVVATAITDKKPFIVLDNVVDALAPKQFIEKCADNTPLLLLTETELIGPWETIHVDQLADLDALVLFKQKSGITVDDHDIDIYGITKLMNYHPQAIVIGARTIVAVKQTPSEYLKNLKQVTEASGDVVDATIALSYRSLNNALQGLLLMLGATFSGEGSVDFIATVSGVPEASITQAMTILSQLYLVEKFDRYGKAYYRLPSKVHAFAQAALKGRNQLDALQKKVHDATLDYARLYSDNATLDYEMLSKEMDNFIAAALWSAENGNRDTANQLVGTLTQADDFVQDAGYVYELLQLRNAASGSTTAFPAYVTEEVEAADDEGTDYYSYDDDGFDDNDDDETIYADLDDDDYDAPILVDDDDVYEEVSLADVTVEEGMSSEALSTDALQSIDVEQLRQALAQARQQGNVAQQVQILKAIGKVQVGQNKETEAITTYNEILNAYDGQNDDEGILDSLNMLAALLNKTGNTQASVMHATRGIQMAQASGDNVTLLQLQTYLGDARQDLGETEAAIEAFKKALEIARTTDDKQNEAISLYKLGYAYLDNGDTDDAIHTLTQARELFKGQEKREYEGRVLGGLASAYSELERWSEAIGYYQSALHTAREVNNKEDEQVTLSNLGQAQVEAGKLPDALLSYRQALHLAYQIGKRDDIVSSTVDLVRLMLMSKRLLGICQLLLDEAKFLEPDDRDVIALQDQIDAARQATDAEGVQQAPVTGTAREYAALAYAVLDE